ncbi:hypothetical protein ACD591_03080 [Rufibacter glacialis]|uniref:Uncharacterized protein n=1 Tax=Rufibacter glacialis TaxID=1259555 RepID=A0A5M8QNV6_9BACT|nr:hypothetical protein [Rufibacter glacialis]KAA6435862.1 hypothetical protein FOE74_07980 [Rufibacter glacialis]GGK67206.1 hypothetical protein GCM10011405_13960 [Rufibacter glacialis]
MEADLKEAAAVPATSPAGADLPFGQEKPRKTGKTKERDTQKNQEVKEVATARRQGKPEKVASEGAKELGSRGSAGRPQSAARPGRGAAAGAIKAAGNATKAVKAGKPVKVGGVGVGRIKVGKN